MGSNENSISPSVGGAEAISLFRMTLALLCPLMVMAFANHLQLEINRKLLVGLVRSVVQLMFAGGVLLGVIFHMNSPWLVFAYLLFMATIASLEVIARQLRSYPGQWRDSFASVLLGGGLVGAYGSVVIFCPSPWWNPRVTVPTTGMILGNSVTGPAISVDRMMGDVCERTHEVELRLAFGADYYEAMLPFLRQAFLVGIMPKLNTMAVVGLVSIPGMMTGQLLGGSTPLVAAEYQLAILWLITTTSAVSTYTALILCAIHALFDTKEHRIVAVGGTENRVQKKAKGKTGIETLIWYWAADYLYAPISAYIQRNTGNDGTNSTGTGRIANDNGTGHRGGGILLRLGSFFGWWRSAAADSRRGQYEPLGRDDREMDDATDAGIEEQDEKLGELGGPATFNRPKNRVSAAGPAAVGAFTAEELVCISEASLSAGIPACTSLPVPAPFSSRDLEAQRGSSSQGPRKNILNNNNKRMDKSQTHISKDAVFCTSVSKVAYKIVENESAFDENGLFGAVRTTSLPLAREESKEGLELERGELEEIRTPLQISASPPSTHRIPTKPSEMGRNTPQFGQICPEDAVLVVEDLNLLNDELLITSSGATVIKRSSSTNLASLQQTDPSLSLACSPAFPPAPTSSAPSMPPSPLSPNAARIALHTKTRSSRVSAHNAGADCGLSEGPSLLFPQRFQCMKNGSFVRHHGVDTDSPLVEALHDTCQQSIEEGRKLQPFQQQQRNQQQHHVSSGGLSFCVRAGERVALVGPSGLGKSRLLRSLALLDPPFCGSITLLSPPYSTPNIADRGVKKYAPATFPPEKKQQQQELEQDSESAGRGRGDRVVWSFQYENSKQVHSSSLWRSAWGGGQSERDEGSCGTAAAAASGSISIKGVCYTTVLAALAIGMKLLHYTRRWIGKFLKSLLRRRCTAASEEREEADELSALAEATSAVPLWRRRVIYVPQALAPLSGSPIDLLKETCGYASYKYLLCTSSSIQGKKANSSDVSPNNIPIGSASNVYNESTGAMDDQTVSIPGQATHLEDLCDQIEDQLLLTRHKLRANWSTLSGGERQRAVIALAIILSKLHQQQTRQDVVSGADSSSTDSPNGTNGTISSGSDRNSSVLLLDEPTAACDAETALAVEKALADCGAAIVLITHSQEQAARFAHRQIVLSISTTDDT